LAQRRYYLEKTWLERRGISLSLELYREMLLKQEGRCAICGDVMRLPQVDHDHAKKRVRGLLCNRCNNGLGCFRDDPTRLERAKIYLTSQPSEN
jgi:5-methylcytosine-specific restriction endonuclease McrA